MPYIKKTPEFEKMEELSKKIPAPLSWVMPDPYDPTSYIMPITGLTKFRTLVETGKVLKKSGLAGKALKEEMAPILKIIKEFPSKYLDKLKWVRQGESLGSYASASFGGGPRISMGVSRGERRPFQVLQHELLHMVQELENPTVYKELQYGKPSQAKVVFPTAPKLEGATEWATRQQLKKLGLPVSKPEFIAHYGKSGWPPVEFATERFLQEGPVSDPIKTMLDYLEMIHKEFYK